VQLITALSAFDACDDFLGWVKEEARQRVQPWGLPGAAGFGGEEVLTVGPMVDRAATTAAAAGTRQADAAAPSEAAAGAGGVPGAGAGTTFSTTNVQEQGVDEPDTVKSDGRRILALAGTRLHVVDATGPTPTEVGSLDLGEDAWGSQLLVAGDTALVLGSQGGLAWRDGRVGVMGSSGSSSDDGSTAALPSAVLHQVDLSDPARPRVAATLRVEGAYLDARLVGTTARIVLQSSPAKLEFLAPSGPRSEGAARRANQQVIGDSTVEQWLPSYVLQRGGDETSGPLVACERVHHPAQFSGFSNVSVLTVDLAAGLTPGDAASVVADGQQVYASAENLYVAVNTYQELEGSGEGGDAGASSVAPSPGWGGSGEGTTAIHKFSVRGSEPASYVASGEVRGHLMNDFSLSEHRGNLRVATTDGPAWGGPVPAVDPSSSEATTGTTSESFVTVLSQQGGELVQVGQVGGLGRGERIYGVRFIGDVGYVVTFRQTDPLYTIDLTDPAAPRARGELKILGYSAYLHPLGDGRVLGVGQDATEEGRRTGAQVSVFDVTNLDDPRLVGKSTLPAGWTEAEHDYHGFLWWDPAKLVALPMQVWSSDGAGAPFAGVVGFTVDGHQVVERGRVAHPAEPVACATSPTEGSGTSPSSPASPPSTGAAVAPPSTATTIAPPSAGAAIAPSMPCPVETYSPPITRSLVIDQTLYTLSEAGLKASNVGDLADVGWLAFA
jgi:uncharacterized secreted protein with C-terminal beta-propeller domain